MFLNELIALHCRWVVENWNLFHSRITSLRREKEQFEVFSYACSKLVSDHKHFGLYIFVKPLMVLKCSISFPSKAIFINGGKCVQMRGMVCKVVRLVVQG